MIAAASSTTPCTIAAHGSTCVGERERCWVAMRGETHLLLRTFLACHAASQGAHFLNGRTSSMRPIDWPQLHTESCVLPLSWTGEGQCAQEARRSIRCLPSGDGHLEGLAVVLAANVVVNLREIA